MAKGLTKRQRNILEYIIEGIRDEGRPPTIAEMCQRFKINSTNGINDHLKALEKKGYIERSSKARGIHVTEKAHAGLYRSDIGVLPLVGQIAAGTPILAEHNVEDYIPVPASRVKEDSYCLRVRGESMIEAGILDGDVIVVDRQRRPNRGDIVVALVDEEEATVKYFHPQNDSIELRPANAQMEPMHFDASQVALQGVVVAVQRDLH